MKNIFLPKVTMCIIALFTFILPASAQNTNAKDEYKETLKKIMDFSGTSTTTDEDVYKRQNGDRVELTLPMSLSMRTWQVNKNSVSVDYGPLTLSLKIAEKYVEKDSRDCNPSSCTRWKI